MGLPGLLTAIWRHRRGRDDRPRFLTHTVTFACNARCSMCDSWKLDTAGELTLAEIDAIYAQLPRLDGVRLTGGEPFVRGDLAEILETARRRLRPRFAHITSNGFLTSRIVELVERREHSLPLHLLVSLDGVDEAHDEVRGVPRAWERAFATLQALAPRRRELNLHLSVNQTVLDAGGLEQARRLRARLAPLGLRSQLVLAYEESATYSTARDREVTPSVARDGGLDDASFESLLAEADADLARAPTAERWAKRFYFDALRRHRDGRPARVGCVALNAHLRLFPDGGVPTCQFNSKLVGNLRHEEFGALWHGERAREQRAWVRGCEGCTAECELLPSAVYSGELLRHALTPRRAPTPRVRPVGATR